jgi:electron transport complex protein RnfE
MAKKQLPLSTIFTSGIWKENAVFRSALGLCPALAVTTSLMNGLGMGVATTGVLVLTSSIISMLRKVISDKIRIPAFIFIIASTVTVMHMLVQAFAPALNSALGIFLPLIAVNCIVFGRGESFARKNKVLPSAMDALGMGLGNILALAMIGGVRELLGAGTLLGHSLFGANFEPISIFILPPGGFLVLAFFITLMNMAAIKKGQKLVVKNCGGCAAASKCAAATKGGC